MIFTWFLHGCKFSIFPVPAGNYTLNALVLHEKEIELYTASGKLLIKA